MLFLKYVLLAGGIAMFLVAAGILAYDLYFEGLRRKAFSKLEAGAVPPESQPIRWRTSIALAMLAWAPLLVAFSIVIVPTGTAGVRISQTEGTRSGTLLINKIVAERLSDKLQIMMVPADGKFFFANDVLRSMSPSTTMTRSEEAEK
jgi:hypothetical protein